MTLDYPSDLPLATPLGQVFLTITDSSHVHIDGRSMPVNGVDISVSIHLNLVDGVWVDTHCYFSRLEGRKDVSWAARRKVVEVVVPSVVAYLQANSSLMVAARVARLRLNRERLVSELRDCEQKMLEIKAQIEAIDKEAQSIKDIPFLG